MICSITFSPLYSFRSKFIITANEYEEMLLNQFDELSDIETALTASGIEPEYFDLYTAEILRWKQNIEDHLPDNASQRNIAQTIVFYLHDQVFSKYKLHATTLKDIFETGYFNCLSATVLVNILLRAFGIDAQTIVLPTHVYTLAVLDGQNTEIENTIKDGLSISENKSSQKKFNELTGFSYNNNKNKKILISWKESIGLLYSNQSYFNAKQKNYDLAFQNMMKAQALLHTAPSEQNNLIAGYLNYSYFNYKNPNAPLQSYLKTLSILEEGISRFPHYQNLKGNYLKGLDIVLEKMILLDSSEQELDTLISNAKEYLSAANFQKIQKSRYLRAVIHNLRTSQNLASAKNNIQKLWSLYPKDKDTANLIKEYTYKVIQTDLKSMNTRSISLNTNIINEFQKFPSELTQESLGCYYSGLSKKYFEIKKFNDSVNIMNRAKTDIGATKLITQNGFVYAVNSAQYFLERENYPRALHFYKQAVSFKDDKQVKENIGIIYEKLVSENLNNKNTIKAKELLNEGLNFLPENTRLKSLSVKTSHQLQNF
ncbi:MAG: hypothetical protein ACRCTQ_03680 [Brevinemataceae bacterium]